MFFACFRFLDDGDPADPFVACQRCEAVPLLKYVGLGLQDFFDVSGDSMQGAGGDGVLWQSSYEKKAPSL